MSSTFRILLWEFCRRGWWRILNTQIAVLCVSAIVYSSLLRAGPLDPQGGRSLHFVLLCILLVSSGGAILAAHGEPNRFYLLPLSNRELTAVAMFPGMVCIAAAYAMTAEILNGWFHVGWPILGPAMFLAATLGAIQAARRITGAGRLTQFAVWCLIAILFENCLRNRYGGGNVLSPQTMWTTVTLGELLSLVAIIGMEFLVMTNSLTRERRGDAAVLSIRPTWPALRTRRTGGGLPRFRSAAAAQFWFEWKQKGLILPSTFAAFATIVLLSYWLNWFKNGEYELLHLCLGYGLGLSPIALVSGLVLGHADLPRAESECGTFLATRPTTTTALTAALLKVEGASLLLTWGLWVLCLMVTTSILYVAQGSEPVIDLWTDHGTLSRQFAAMGVWFAVSMVGISLGSAWSFLSLASSLALTGRQRFLVTFVVGSVPALLVMLFVVAAREEGHAILPEEVTQIVMGSLAGFGALLAFVLARRRGLIGWTACGAALVGWMLLCGLWGSVSGQVGSWSSAIVIQMVGWLALPLAPFATGPLALSWNRHR